MYLGKWEIDDLLTFTVTTHTFATGALTDADAVPSYRVYEDETGTPILTGSMAKLDDSNTTGHYSEQLTLSAANGFEVGKTYSIYITAAVSSVTGGAVRSFQVEAAPATATALQTVDDLVDDLEGRLTSTRAGYLDNLSAGAVATAAALTTVAGYVDTEVAAVLAAVDTEIAAIKTKTDYLPSATAGAAGGLFIAGSNAATSVTTALTANITGNVSGSVASVSGAVGSVSGSVGSVTGSVGGNVTGSVGSVATGGITAASIATGAIDADALATDAVAEIQNGLSTLAATDVRTAIGLASANLDTQLADVPTVAEFEARTLPTASYFDPAADPVIVGTIQADAITASAIATAAAQEIADAILGRSVSSVEATAAEHSLATIILAALESAIVDTTWTIKRTDGITTHIVKTVATDADAEPITGVA